MKTRKILERLLITALIVILAIVLVVSMPKESAIKTMINNIRLALGEGPTITITGIPDNTPIRASIPITITATSDKGIAKIAVNGVEIEHNNGVATYLIEQNGTYVVTATDGDGVMQTQTVTITQIDKTPPSKTAPEATSTLNSITVTFKQTDSGSGISNNKKYRLTNREGTTGTWIEITENQYTFTGLEDGVVYYVQTRAQDTVGNESMSEVTRISTQVPDISELITVTKTPPTAWAKQVIITITLRDSGKYSVLTSTDGTSFTEATRIVVEENTKVYAKLVNGDAEGELVEIAEVTNADNIPPTTTAPTTTVTANKITVTNKQEDTLSGLNNSKTRYRLLKDAAAEQVVVDWQASNTFTGLDSVTDYYVQTKSEDILGNTSFSKTTKATTQAITPGSSAQINYNSAWTNQDVVVTVTNPSTEYTMEISLDGTTWNTTSPITFRENGTIYTRFTDGRNYGVVGVKEITNIDKIAPTNTAPTVIATEDSLTVTNNQTDEISGIETVQFRFATDESGSASLPGYDWSTTREYRNLPPDTTFFVQTKTIDKAGNQTLSVIKKASTTPIPSTEGVLSFTAEPAEGCTKKVVVSFEITDENLRTRYRLELSADGQNYSEPGNQTIEVTENGPIYTRFTDGRYNGNGYIYYTVENVDNTPPTMTAPTGETTENTITVTSNQVDNESGLNRVWYRLATDAEGTASLNGHDWQDSNVFTGLTANTKYYIQTKAKDNMDNVSESLTTEITTWVVPDISNLTLTANPAEEWTNGDVTVTANYNQRTFQVQLSIDGVNYETADSIVVSENGTVFARFINGDIPGTAITTIPITNIDKTAPTQTAPTAVATTRKITITNKQDDTQSGIKRVEYRLVADAEGTASLDGYDWKDVPEFDELNQGTTYYVQTRAEDNVGNMSESEIIEITTKTVESAVGKIIISQNPNTWTRDHVTISASGSAEGFYIEMSKDGVEYFRGTMFEIEENTVVYARFTDGTNSGEPVSITVLNIDKTPPTTTKPTVEATKTRLTVTNQQTDSQSGINTGKTRYRLVTDAEATESLEGHDWQDSNIFNNLPSDTTFYVQTKSEDNVGNNSESKVTTTRTEEIPSAQYNITYEKTPGEWTNNYVLITFENSQSDYSIEYSLNGQDYELIENNELRIDENCTIYVRLTNGISYGREMPIIINNIDKVKPNLSITGANIRSRSIEVIVDAQDSLSGIKEIKYLISEENPENVSLSNENWKNEGKFTNLKENTEYFIKVAAIDNAGNVTTVVARFTTRDSQGEVSSEVYNIKEDEKIITKVPLFTTVDEFKENITVNGEYTIVNRDGEEVSFGNMQTGFKLITDSDEYEIAVICDVAPNGRLDIADLAWLRAHILETTGKMLTGANYYAADVDNSGEVNIIDLAKMRKMILEQ